MKAFRFITMVMVFMFVFSISVFAASPNDVSVQVNNAPIPAVLMSQINSISAVPVTSPEDVNTILATPTPALKSNAQVNASLQTTPTPVVAELSIYADSGSSSSWSTDGHAWITIKNISSSNITVGYFGNIAPNKMMSLGTWGNKNEHTGLWYDLESYFYSNINAFTTSKSISMSINATQLNTVNSYILNHDSWSVLNNCSSFACGLWNSVSSTQLSAGIPNTPTSLRISIINSGYYVYTGRAMSWDYIVYYAQGSGSVPIASTEFT
jgi:hypothetical protein